VAAAEDDTDGAEDKPKLCWPFNGIANFRGAKPQAAK
jgi:hypothetical protein